ncbi:hypothetical protein ACIQVO_38760 [Streptomyces sp. NPDC101062]|uniref:hypothetical protein n=1 Tax=unclassified Streptomyces TaxID=2593676 RepID=UPI003805A930
MKITFDPSNESYADAHRRLRLAYHQNNTDGSRPRTRTVPYPGKTVLLEDLPENSTQQT